MSGSRAPVTQGRQNACGHCWTTPDGYANSSPSSRPWLCDRSKTIPHNQTPDRPICARSKPKVTGSDAPGREPQFSVGPHGRYVLLHMQLLLHTALERLR
jgi:hypothetical protein